MKKTLVKMIQDIGNNLEAKIDKIQETMSKIIGYLRIKQAEIQNTITEIYSLEATNSRLQAGPPSSIQLTHSQQPKGLLHLASLSIQDQMF